MNARWIAGEPGFRDKLVFLLNPRYDLLEREFVANQLLIYSLNLILLTLQLPVVERLAVLSRHECLIHFHIFAGDVLVTIVVKFHIWRFMILPEELFVVVLHHIIFWYRSSLDLLLSSILRLFVGSLLFVVCS